MTLLIVKITSYQKNIDILIKELLLVINSSCYEIDNINRKIRIN